MPSTNHTEITERICALLAQALQISLEEVSPELAFGDIPQWDSMGHMEILLQLEQNFGVSVDTDTITQLTSLPAIQHYLEQNNLVR